MSMWPFIQHGKLLLAVVLLLTIGGEIDHAPGLDISCLLE